MRMNQKAIIIGGGIAGPAVALFLQRAGIEAEIYEEHSESDEPAGLFLNLAGNGIDVLQTLGLDKLIAAQGSPVPRMIMLNSKGKQLGETRNGARAGLTESVVIRRSTLNSLLRQAAIEQGIPVHYGKKLRALENGDGVVASFEDGTTASGTLLIGCDGIHSRTRQIINPDAPKARYTGLVSTGGFTFEPKLPPTPGVQYFVFGQRAFFGYHVRSSGEIYWFNNHMQAQEPDQSAHRRVTSNEWRERLLEMHKADMPLIRAIIESTKEGISGYPIYDIPTQPVWYKGNVVLAGDALHAISPSSGQGVSMALEDAAVLAKCLRDFPTYEQAFAAYERLRRPRVERMVKWASKLGATKTASTPIQAWFRDLLLPFFLKFAANPAALDWVYSYPVVWEQRVAA